MDSRFLWLVYAVTAGLCWGTYVPLIAQGGKKLESPLASFLCVGLAYFLIAILFPLAMFYLAGEKKPTITIGGVSFASLAGVAGALGALCVIFANRAAPNPQDKLYIDPIVFALAPILTSVVSLLWHPEKGPFHFGLPEHLPGWKLYLGILLAGIGAALVLYSKEEGHVQKAAKQSTAVVESAITAPAAPN